MTQQAFGGDWTAQKLAILSEYLSSYTTALKNQGFDLVYVDAFAGYGSYQPGAAYDSAEYADFQEMRDGSPKRALRVRDKPFDRLVFIEKDPAGCQALESLKDEFPGRSIEIRDEDANIALPNLCAALRSFDRAVVFLDPFATQVSWDTVAALAQTGKIDCWILFPLMAIARMMPRETAPSEPLAVQLDRIFGGREYWSELYRVALQQPLFPLDDAPVQERPGNSDFIAACYRERLESVFFRVAPTSRTLRNRRNSPLFELFFAASNPAGTGAGIAVNIADHILRNW